MKALFLLTSLALTAAAPASAQQFTTSTPDRIGESRLNAQAAAQAARIKELNQKAEAAAAELAKRTNCESQGKLYLPGHAAHDAAGCVDPSSL